VSRATKDRILAGREPEPFAVPALDGDEVLLRPLSSPEAQAVQAAQVAGIHVSQALRARRPEGRVGEREAGRPQPRAAAAEDGKADIDLSEVVKGSYEANVLAAHYGLVDPALSVDELRQIRPTQVVEQIGQEVRARSGLGRNQADELARFRELAGGTDDAGPAHVREPADGDAG
jgi:hypothetical protein